MADKARRWTDKQLERMERRITRIYKEAEKDMRVEWDAYMKRLDKRLEKKQAALQKAILSGDSAEIKEAKEDLQNSIRWGTLMNKKYQAMVDNTVDKLTNVNKIALAYVNGELPKIYAQNYNGISSDIQQVVKAYEWTAVNEETVRQLTVLDDRLLLPPKKINIPKDKRWNKKQINNSVLQGLLQGESIPKIAKRIETVTGSNKKAAIRNARTMVTAAENRGRLAGMERAERNGIILKKQWLSTGDSRTRDWHLSIDGQTVDTDKPFIDGNGNEIDYPGDRTAPPSTVYNCRCTMVSQVIGFRKADGHIDYINSTDSEDLHDKQIAEEREKRAENA